MPSLLPVQSVHEEFLHLSGGRRAGGVPETNHREKRKGENEHAGVLLLLLLMFKKMFLGPSRNKNGGLLLSQAHCPDRIEETVSN